MMQRFGINTSAAISLVVIIITAVAILWQVPKLWSAAWGSTSDEQTPADTLARFVAGHEDIHHQYQSRFDGRSVFHTPPPTPRPVPRRPVERDPDPDPEPVYVDPGPPAVYQGPSLVAIIGNEAWFKPPREGDNVLQIPIGEAREGVELVSINSIFGVTVRYRDGEYDVSLFDQWNPEAPFKETPTPAGAVPGLEDVPKEDPKVTEEDEEKGQDTEVEAQPLDVSLPGSENKEKPEAEEKEDEPPEDNPRRTSTTATKED